MTEPDGHRAPERGLVPQGGTGLWLGQENDVAETGRVTLSGVTTLLPTTAAQSSPLFFVAGPGRLAVS